MQKTCLNGHNRRMRTLVALAAIGLIAGCGGGGGSDKSEKPASPAASSPGGVVSADATKGVLLPAIGVENGKVVVTGKGGPISAKENRPTDAQRNGVAAAGACASTSANPAPSNLGALSSSILCLLNAE